MAYKISVIETSGNQDDIETAIQTELNGLTIAAGSSPSITVTGFIRKMVYILYRDS